MTMFSDPRGTSRLISRIDRITAEVEDGPRKGRRLVTMIDGEEIYIYRKEAERIEALGHPVVSAEPGTTLVTFHAFYNTGPDEWCADEQPVIAWRVNPDGPEPVVIDWSWFRPDSYTAIRTPDGLLRDTEGETWDSISSFEESARGWCIADRADKEKTTDA